MQGMAGDMNVWVWVRTTSDGIGEETYGLLSEAGRILSQGGSKGAVTAVVEGGELQDDVLKGLGSYGADSVVRIPGGPGESLKSEYDALALAALLSKEQPSFLFMAQDEETADMAARLAARLEIPLLTRVVDLKWGKDGKAVVHRPVSNGYLFEEREFSCGTTAAVCFLPHVLNPAGPRVGAEAEVVTAGMPQADELAVRVLGTTEADPHDLGLDEAEIVVSGGRGVGKGEAFNLMHELAKALGGTVGGIRPVIDLGVLPFERQIGQTGKTVLPRLLFACGISGANEYTAGMEKSQRVIAVNIDPRARIFRFSDLGVVGDVHEVVPLLIARINECKEKKS